MKRLVGKLPTQNGSRTVVGGGRLSRAREKGTAGADSVIRRAVGKNNREVARVWEAGRRGSGGEAKDAGGRWERAGESERELVGVLYLQTSPGLVGVAQVLGGGNVRPGRCEGGDGGVSIGG